MMNPKKKWLSMITYLFVLFGTASCFAQEADPYIDELNRMVKVPNSPEAASFQEYGNTSVSLYTGTPNISVPIYNFQGIELDMPAKLTYDASGIKVEQLANQAGLGWNLALGGRISRVVNGLPDDYYVSSPNAYLSFYCSTVKSDILLYKDKTSFFDSSQEALDYVTFKQNISKNIIDTEPDYYSLAALGINDYIVFDFKYNTAKTLNNPRIKVEPFYGSLGYTNSPCSGALESWIITDEDGTKYYFEEAEVTEYQGDDGAPHSGFGIRRVYNSSWVLTKVVSSNGKDTYEFDYYTMPDWTQAKSISGSSFLSYSVTNASPNTIGEVPINSNSLPTYFIKQKLIDKVYHNTKQIYQIDLKSRSDLSIDSAIDEFKIFEPGQTAPHRSIKFNHTYFGDVNHSSPLEALRLKLDDLEVYSAQNVLEQSYSFEYFNEAGVPLISSLDQDYLGYFNNAGNSVLYPEITLGNRTFQGADRDPNFNHAIKGTLKSITYPTKGKTEFEYESNYSLETYEDMSTELTRISYGSVHSALNNTANVNCGPCCQDTYVNTPNVTSFVFDIDEQGTYDLSYSIDGSGGDFVEGVLVRKSNLLANGTCDPTPLLYDEVIDQSSCQVIGDNKWSVQTSSTISAGNQTPIVLEPGCYQLMTIIDSNSLKSMSISVSREELTSNNNGLSNNHVRAGIRIKDIKDYDSDNQLKRHKSYKYVLDINDVEEKTSGVLNARVTLYTVDEITDPITEDVTTMVNRYGSANLGQQPHIAYSTVFEINRSTVDGSYEGYVKNEFYNGISGLKTQGISPSITTYYEDMKVGSLKEQETYDENDAPLRSLQDDYQYTNIFSVPGLLIENVPANQHKIMAIETLGANSYKLHYLDPDTSSGGSTLPNICNDPNYTCYTGEQGQALLLHQTYAQGRSNNKTASVQIDHLDGSASVTSEQTIFGDQYKLFLPLEKRTTNSKNETLITSYEYPDVTSALRQKNDLITPIKIVDSLDGVEQKVLKTVEREYTEFNSEVVMPTLVKTYKADEPPTIFNFSYDNAGYLVSANRESGPESIFIWGYNKMYPIAKIENATTAQVAPFVNNLEITSDLDTDRTRDTIDSNGTITYIGAEGDLREALDNLRTALPNALITSYTYDPGIGVTSITDSRGYTMYYEYDDFHRLKDVKDAKGNLINDYKYHYKGQN